MSYTRSDYSSSLQLGSALTDHSHLPNRVNFFNKNPLKISSGYNHVCALLDDKSIWCWGSNSYGQLGMRQAPSDSNCLPEQVQYLDSRAKNIFSGTNYSCALLDNDEVQCWGLNDSGQLGGLRNNNNNLPNYIPEIVAGLNGYTSEVFSGSGHTCALLKDGTVNCWGFNRYGEIGNTPNIKTGSPNPYPLEVVLYSTKTLKLMEHSFGNFTCRIRS